LNNKINIALKENLGFRILSSFVIVIIFVLTAYTLFSVVREGNKEKKSLRERGEILVGLLSKRSTVGVFAENKEMLKDVVSDVIGLRDVLSITIYNSNARVLYSRHKALSVSSRATPYDNAIDNLRFTGPLNIVETPNAFEFLKPVALRPVGQGDETLYFSAPATGESGRVIGYVSIALSKDTYRREIASVIEQNAVIMVIFIIISITIIHILVKKVTNPLKTLTNKVKAFEKGLPIDPLPVETTDEVGNLAAAFNAMTVARGQAENSLRESEERYRRLVELSPDAIYVQHDDKFMFINTSGATLFGALDPSRLLGQQVSNHIDEKDREYVRKRIKQVQENGTISPLLQAKHLKLDGTTVDVEMSVSPFVIMGVQAVLVIARDVTARKGMEEQIRTYQKELHSVTSEMLSLESRIEERERNLIATDLHDFVGQNLLALNFKLSMLRRSLSSPESIGQLDELREIVEQTIQHTRSLTVELSPPILIELGLKDAFYDLAEGFEKTYGIQVSVEDDGQPKPIDDNSRYLLFRCVRELLVNVVKHSKADTVMISLTRTENNIEITVADNGIGFDAVLAAGKNKRFGLFTIRDRMRRLGGYCEIVTERGSGTKVVLVSPITFESVKGGPDNGH